MASMASKDVQFFKFSHSISFEHINESELQEKIKPNNPKIDRIPSLPALVPDLSVEIAEEMRKRRTLHAELIEKNKATFRRCAVPDSCSHYLIQKLVVKDLLPTMHPIRDEASLRPPKTGYTYSRRKDNNVRELYTKIEDFLQPTNQSRPRSVGFSPGHVRSMAGFDSFGPSHSEQLDQMRIDGSLPSRHNPDRNSPSNSRSSSGQFGDQMERFGDTREDTQFSKSLFDPSSSSPFGTSRPFRSSSKSRQNTTRSFTLPGMTAGSMSSSASLSRMNTYNSSLRTSVIEVDDRLLVDPRAKGLLWEASYRHQMEDIAESRREAYRVRQSRLQEQKAGQEVKENISFFEEKLKSMNRYH